MSSVFFAYAGLTNRAGPEYHEIKHIYGEDIMLSSKLHGTFNINIQSYGISPVFIIAVIAVIAVSLAVLFVFLYDPGWFSRRISRIKALKSRIYVRNAMGSKELQKAVRDSGFDYDSGQDIFYSLMNPWQRQYGYTRLYDELCPLFSMIVDSEPIYFYYDQKNWMIEFWKGQYGMTTGCEVGIYTKAGGPLNNPQTAFYDCADDRDRLFLSFSLIKNRRIIFTRADKHWWLTGFMLGEFSQPYDLIAEIGITFNNKKMRDAFLQGLERAGYSENEYKVTRNTVSVLFYEPHSVQPSTRTPITDAITQEKNFLLCKSFVEITASKVKLGDKMAEVESGSPALMAHILNIGKPRRLFGHIKKGERAD